MSTTNAGKRLLLLFCTAFLLYQIPLPVFAPRPYSDFWHFEADSYRVAMEKFGRHPLAKWQTVKHPLVVAVKTPLHHCAKWAYRTMFPEPLAENLALTFPSAVLGALNAVVAYLIFLQVGFTAWPAVLLTVFYAGSASIWVFSSFPDSYICITLFANILLLALLKDPEFNRWRLNAVLTALAGFCAPQQLLLTIIPAVLLLRLGLNRVRAARLCQYGIAVVILYVIPFLLQMALLTRGTTMINSEVNHWASIGNLVNPQWWATVGVTFLSLAVAITAPVESLGNLKLEVLLSYKGTWIVTGLIALYATCGWLRPQEKASTRFRHMNLALAAYCIVYLTFFVWWTPSQAFLFTAPVLLPFWLILHSWWLGTQDKLWWRAGMAAACLLVMASSLLTLWEARDIVEYKRVASTRPYQD